jgi:enamine deaminase RidA (YjgF/YER057c/UK114 family)
MARKKMTEKEKQDWESLYMYVKSNIMGYDENQALSSTMVLRLKGLLTNKFIENNSIQSTANYSYETVLNAFKYSSLDIQRVLRTNSFKDEMHKFNYVLKIVEKNINTVYMKMKNAQKAKEEAKNTAVEAPTHTGAEFKPKENKKDKFTDLW